MPIANVSLNQIKLLGKATGNYLFYYGATDVTIYYVNQSPVIFKAIVKKDSQDKFNLFLQQLPQNQVNISKPLEQDILSDEIKKLRKQIENLQRTIILRKL